MLIDAWNMVVNGAFYHDPAPTTPPDTTLGKPKQKPSNNCRPLATQSLSNPSPTPPNT
ncbi:hypothetical protein I546_7350, partial [Mycobacterium kansasii 732]